MKVIGITGGIGGGKSVVMDMLEKRYGVKTIIADRLGHKAMEKGCDTYRKMVEAFGRGILRDDGEIDRRKLSEVLFSDEAKLCKQNAIVHPFVRNEIDRQLNEWESGKEAVAAIESAILIEAGCGERCDEIWFVTAESEVRIKRLMQARGYTRNMAENFIRRQKSDAEYGKICDRILYNNGDVENLYKQLEKGIEHLMSV